MDPPNAAQVSQWAAWAPVIASTITGSLSILAVVVVQAWTARRERQARDRDAAEKRAHRWDEFKLKTLVELQDAIGQVGPALSDAIVERGGIGGESISRRSLERAGGALTALCTRMAILDGRVGDEELTRRVEALRVEIGEHRHREVDEVISDQTMMVMHLVAACIDRSSKLILALRPITITG